MDDTNVDAINGDETLPIYTAIDHLDDATVIQRYKDGIGADKLPITHYPASTSSTSKLDLTVNLHVEQILTTFFTAIRTKNDTAVTLLLSNNLVTPDTTSQSGETPLLAAISSSPSPRMIRTLLSAGAGPNLFGTSAGASRTPLMLAAETGALPVVKLLLEEAGADDALVAPDGQLALRLAAAAGRRDVVAYLPARRGGEWRRWKAHHAVAVARAERAARAIWKAIVLLGKCAVFPFRCLFYDIPNVLVKSMHRFPGWCRRQIEKAPDRARRALKLAKRVPGKVLKELKMIPDRWRRTAKKLEEVGSQVARGLWRAVREVAMALVAIIEKMISLVHSAIFAIWTRLRSVTLKDLASGLRTMLEAVFVDLPKSVGRLLLKFLSGTGEFVKAFGRNFGKVVVWIAKALVWVTWQAVSWVPRHIFEIMAAMFSSMKKGYHEMRVWMSPKYQA